VNNTIERWKKGTGKEIKKYPTRSVITFILLLTLAVAFVGALKQYNWLSVFEIIAISILICLPMVIGKLSKIDIPLPFWILAVAFIYASLFLGEVKNYYAAYWWWDVLLHAAAGLGFGIIGFVILYMIYKTGKIKTSPKMVAVFSFAFALTIGTLWEIVEFAIDNTLGFISNGVPMQSLVNGCGLVDTMKDLILDSAGALFSSIMGYLYLTKDSGIVVKPLMKEFKKGNPRLFKKRR